MTTDPCDPEMTLGLAPFLAKPGLPSPPEWLCEQCLRPSDELTLFQDCEMRGAFSLFAASDPVPGHTQVDYWICFDFAESADLRRRRKNVYKSEPFPSAQLIREFKDHRHEALWVREHIRVLLKGEVCLTSGFRYFKMERPPKGG